MTDRELLEAAAKAAGIVLATFDENDVPTAESHARIWPRGEMQGIAKTVLFWNDSRDHPMCRKPSKPGNVEWNPLTDDGDALRLAVKLNLQVTPGTYRDHEATAFHAGKGEAHERVHYQQDLYAATRRAIVRAAAAAGQRDEKREPSE